MNKLTIKKIAAGILTVMVLSIFALPAVVSAQDLDLGLENAAGIGLGDKDLKDSINSIIQIILSFLGILAVIIILWGGFIWMTAAGDDTKVGKAKSLIISGIVGIVIILSAYIIANFVITQVGGQLQS
jgi:type IV secretory pathway VirB2 component (pilin)